MSLALLFCPDFDDGCLPINCQGDTVTPTTCFDLRPGRNNHYWQVGRFGIQAQSCYQNDLILGGNPPNAHAGLFSRRHFTILYRELDDGYPFYFLVNGGYYTDGSGELQYAPSTNGVWHCRPGQSSGHWLPRADYHTGKRLQIAPGDRIQLLRDHPHLDCKIIVLESCNDSAAVDPAVWDDNDWPQDPPVNPGDSRPTWEVDEDNLPVSGAGWVRVPEPEKEKAAVAAAVAAVQNREEIPLPDGPSTLRWGVQIANWLISNGWGWVLWLVGGIGVIGGGGYLAVQHAEPLHVLFARTSEGTPWAALQNGNADYTTQKRLRVEAILQRLLEETAKDSQFLIRVILRVYVNSRLGRLASDIYFKQPGIEPLPQNIWLVDLYTEGYRQAQEDFNVGECSLRITSEFAPNALISQAADRTKSNVIYSCSDRFNEHGYISLAWGAIPPDILEQMPADKPPAEQRRWLKAEFDRQFQAPLQQAVEDVGQVLEW